MRYLDFTKYENDIYKSYGGANGGKLSIIIDGDRYMLKFPPIAKNNSQMSYSNSCISEYISCNILKILGFNVQETILGVYKDKIAVACKDFEVDGLRLYEFAKIKNMTIDTPGYNTDIEEILNTISWQNLIDSEELLEFFWNMFVIDSYLGNFDRHNGNWGFLIDDINKYSKIAPIYDCGSCLFPQNTEEQMYNILNDNRSINYRVYSQPNSAIKYNGVRINYYEFIKDNYRNKYLNDSLNLVGNRIIENEIEINKFIDNVEYITDIHKRFIKTILSERFDKIIKPYINKSKPSILEW